MATYGDLKGVKDRLGMPVTDSKQDDTLTRGLNWGSNFIQAMLAANGVTVPASAASGTLLGDATCDLAAYYFHRNLKPDVASLFRTDALSVLSAYIDGERGIGTFQRTSREM